LEDLFGLPTESRKEQEFAKAMRRDEEKTYALLFFDCLRDIGYPVGTARDAKRSSG
jgi:hypothetical protein